MRISETNLKGCFEITGQHHLDRRGWFFKSFQNSVMNELGLNFNMAELYFSSSRKGVIRGMHYQKPPKDHTKIVSCLRGRVFDVVVDIRRSSDTFGQFTAFHLKERDGKMIFIPTGFAHGFCSLEDNSILSYLVSSEHSPRHDEGIHWKGLGITWPTSEPIISDRDSRLPSLSTFQTPFK